MTLRLLASAAESVPYDVVGITPWRQLASGELEILLHPANTLRRRTPPIREDEFVVGITAPRSARVVLGMLERHGLCHVPEMFGSDMALTGNTDVAFETIRQLLAVVERLPTHTYPSSFKRDENG